MANHACIAIGINRYQFLQPLNYGQADAQALQQFLVNQANVPAEDCLLLTDTSVPIQDQSTYPNRETIEQWLEKGYRHSRRQNRDAHAQGWRWFFFSGYGVCWQQVDYLMPIDGNPNDIPGTGIAVRSLLKALKTASQDNILVFLDINRSPGLQTGSPAGAETVELARELGIALILSSQLDQFSHEAAALGNGLFTAALLEALRYHHREMTLADLTQYLSDRLPELSKHHWRPIQTPLMIIPNAQFNPQLIFPAAMPPLVLESATTATRPSNPQMESQDGYPESPNGATASVPVVDQPSITALIPATSKSLNHQTFIPKALITSSTRPSPDRTEQKPWWQEKWRFLAGGFVLLLVLLLGTLTLRNRYVGTHQQAIEEEKNIENEEKTPDAQNPRKMPEARASATPQQQGLSPSPPSNESRLRVNQKTLAQAKRLIQPNQASLFSQAIAQARKIQPGDPLYNQAQEDIQRWSQVILDLAEGRARQGNFTGAIAAASVIPRDNPSVYTQAQQAIQQWQIAAKQQQHNQKIIQQAKQYLQPAQASSYNRGIAALRQIPSDQPGYAEAQQLITQWSRQIYLLANSRARQGKLRQAMQTATLVPSGTPAYAAAQTAIARWKTGKR